MSKFAKTKWFKILIIIFVVGVGYGLLRGIAYYKQKNSGMIMVERHYDCDIDFDGDCDKNDYELVIKAVGQCEDGGNYNEPADADHDGCVTEKDLRFLFSEPPK